MTPRTGPSWQLPLVAVLFVAAAHLALQIAAWRVAGGVFEYPLDDPYIHMAMAEQILHGGYGVNAGEAAAAASSPLYPLLLLPFAGQEVQRYLPLFWNVVGLLLAAVLWGRILWQSGFGRSGWGFVLAALGPLALNFEGLAYTGMEHMLHVAASLSIILGLLQLADEDRLSPALVLGILFSPLLRFEGAALALLAAAAVFFTGRRVQGLWLMALAIVPLMLFCGFLVSLGLDPLPSSVKAKLHSPEAAGKGLFGWLGLKFGALLSERREQILGLFLLLAAIFAFLRDIRASRRWLILPVIFGAGLAHFLFGRFGWVDRYEIYIYAAMAAGLLAAAAAWRGQILSALVAAPLIIAAVLYMPLTLNLYPIAGRAVYVQQGQMARFAKQFLKEPVAVNDIGYIAWRNPDYVLDVWGLANQEALRLRVDEDQPPHWLGRLTDAQDVPFAMVYDHWFPSELVGEDWVLLGQLSTDVPAYYLGGVLVNFYLTDGDADPAPYLEKLRAWARDLPPGASFTFAVPPGPEVTG